MTKIVATFSIVAFDLRPTLWASPFSPVPRRRLGRALGQRWHRGRGNAGDGELQLRAKRARAYG